MNKNLLENDLPFAASCSGDGKDFMTCRAEKLEQGCRVTFRNMDPENTFKGTLHLTRKLDPAHFTDPFLMVPGFFYNNRTHGSRGIIYDPDCTEPHDRIASSWDFAADRCASPLIYAWQNDTACAFAADPHYTCTPGCISDDPEPQCGVGFSASELRINIPAFEVPFTYSGLENISPNLRTITIPPGCEVSITVYCYDAAGPQNTYRKFVRDYSLMMRSTNPAAEMPSPDEVLDCAADGMFAHYHPSGYFIYSRPYFPVIEQIANMRNHSSAEWHQMNTGFVNGFPICLALFRTGKYTDIAEKVADRICLEGVSPSGLFYADYMPKTIESPNGSFPNDIYHSGRKGEWGSGWLSNPDWVHSRTISDACLSLAHMILLKPEKKLWRDALKKNLECVLDLQLENGSFGQYYNSAEKTVVKKDGCGGLLWISALLLSLQIYSDDPQYCQRAAAAAERAGEYYKSYVFADNIWGAPEDNDSPTSEDGMNAVMAYGALYKHAPSEHWLEVWRHAADWMLTFRKTYNVIVPEKSLIGIYEMRSRGGDFASASNNHLHVFEVLCIPELLDLAEVTGDDWYRISAEESFAFAAQYLAMANGQFAGFRGAMAEQFYWNDWNSLGGTWKKADFYAQKGSCTLFTAVWCIMVIAQAASFMKNR